MSFFTDSTLASYAFGFANGHKAKPGFKAYTYPDEWRLSENSAEWQANNINVVPTLPAIDSIHSRRCLAIGDNAISLGSDAAIWYQEGVIDQYCSEVSEYVNFAVLKFSPVIAIPGPGFVVTLANGSIFVLQCRMRATAGFQAWYAYRVTVSAGIITDWVDDTTGPWIATNSTISSVSAYKQSVFDMLPVPDVYFDAVTCRSITLLCYDHTDSITTYLPAGIQWVENPEYYIQCIAGTHITKHSWPAWLNDSSVDIDAGMKSCQLTEVYPADSVSGLGDQVVSQLQKSFRNISGLSNGYVMQASDASRLRMVAVSGNVWLDGITFDSCGVYLDADPAKTKAIGISNCVFSNAEIALRTTYLPSGKVSGGPEVIRGQEQFILQNLFLNCVRAISDDMIQSYLGTTAPRSSEHTKPWMFRREIGFNTFDRCGQSLEIEKNPAFETRAGLFCNVMIRPTTNEPQRVDLTDFRSYGNISDQQLLWAGYDNRTVAGLDYCQEANNGYRPSLASWYANEMSALYCPYDCCMSADITGVRHPFFGNRTTTRHLASPARVWSQANPANAIVLLYNGGITCSTLAEAEAGRKAIMWGSYSNSAKGCFNPVIPSMSNHLFYSVGRASDNFLKSKGLFNPDAPSGAFGYLHIESGVLRVQNMAGAYECGCGDVLTCVQYEKEISVLTSHDVEFMCVGLICPGVYLVRNVDGSAVTSFYGDTDMVPTVITGARRKYNSLQTAIGSVHASYPSLSDLGKIVSLVCYDDEFVSGDNVLDTGGSDGCITIPADWASSPAGRLVIVASNSAQLSVEKQSFVDNPGHGFGLRYDATGAAMINVGANTDYVQIRGLRLIGESIRGVSAPVSYIGIGLGSGVTKFMADSNVFLNCTTGLTQ